ncbi:unnamed protein product [Rhodiola kirilowii]
MTEPQTPDPSHQNHNPRPPPVVITSQWMIGKEVNKHNGDDSPVRIDHPVVGLESADEPEDAIYIDEEESVGEEKRVAEAPIPQTRWRFGVVVSEKSDVEEDGRKRN